MAEVCQFILNNEEFNLDEIDGKAVLFYAAQNGLEEVVKRLYDAGLDLDITDDEGKTAVFYANESHSMGVLCELIGCDAEFKLDEIDGKAVLFYAAKNDKPLVVCKLHPKGLDLNTTDDEGKTAVFYANKNHSMVALYELIIWDAEFKLDEIDGKAVLFYAAKNDQPGVVWKLHEKGLDLNTTDDEGKTAVFYANKNHSMEALCDLIGCDAEFKFDEIDGKAVLFYAARNDQSGVVWELHEKGLDLNTTDDEGKTAVFYANKYYSMEALCELIGCDAEFNLDEIDGKAVLFYVAKSDKPLVVCELHPKGLDLNTTDDEGKTAVFYANKNQSMGVLCDLIGCDAEFKLDEIDGKAVLFYAAKNDFVKVVIPLYDAGLDLNTTDDEGKTAVFYAGNEFRDALMAAGEIFVNARDLYGRTPLFYALEDYTMEKARYLIEEGGNLQLKDSCNVSIYSFFIENCISKNVDKLQSFTPELFQEQQQLKALTLATLDIIYCQAPLLSVSGSPHLPKSYTIFNKTNVLEVLTFVRAQYSNQDADKIEDIDKISLMINENEIDVPRMLSLLNQLGANPIAADSDGNTALHYATLLPLFGVTQETVMDIFKKLREFGAIFNVKNHHRQSPLQFCLSSDTWKMFTENNKWQSSIRGLVEVCRFLLSNGCSINDTSQDGESVFHRIIALIQHGLELNDEASRKVVSQVLIDILKLLQPSKKAGVNVVNNIDNLLNSPLHLWASITLKSSQDYTSCMTEDSTFENILQIIFDHLLECGAKLNPRNANEETPLHLCKTWTAVKLLLDAGANPTDVDSSGRPPLLVAAKEKNFLKKSDYFYPDVTEDPERFWRNALEKGLDPWTVDKQGESVLSVLIKSEAYILAKALVEVACKENHTTNDVKLSLLNTICKDESRHTHWKTILVEVILKSASKSDLSVVSPLRLCCTNIVQFGMFDEKPDSFQQKQKDEPSNDDGQPPSKKRRKDESSKNEEEKEESSKEQANNDSVHCKIAKQLLLYCGMDRSVRDLTVNSCLDIAEDYPPLKDLLTNPIEIGTIPIVIPWTSVSDKHKGILAKTARRQECEVVGQIWYNRDQIGSGSFGSIFAGINEKDGREVAIKRIEKLRMPKPQDRREIEHLTALADCEQVVRYIFFFEGGQFSYIVLELMEGNLKEFLNGTTTHATQSTLLCKDVVMGLKFLHQQNILHRDLKPENILYKAHPKLCLKIADFGLSRIIDSVSTTVYGTLAGTRCWIAPEVLNSKTSCFAPASDMFSCGLILHYILSGQKHPFNPTDCANKSEVKVENETEDNIMNSTKMNSKMEGWDNSLFPEATHLVKRMLESNEGNRPSAEEALEHPLFWSNEKKVDFLKAVGNQAEFECPRSKRTPPLTPVETDLENSFSTIVTHGSWSSSRYKHMPGIYTGMTKGKGRKKYNTSSAVELIRFIRNINEHYREKSFVFATPVTTVTPVSTVTPVTIEQLLLKDFVFLKHFPDLVMEVYKAVTTHGWDQTRDDINFAMNKK